MLEININDKGHLPIYRQISEQVKQHIANNQLKPGERMPTVRELSGTLRVNPATVARAYQELEQEGILGASRRRGTIVMGESQSPQRLPLRQSRLAATVNNMILETLSLGYNPEELEAAFSLQLARWRFQRDSQPAVPEVEAVRPPVPKLIRVVGSNDLALDLLISRLKYRNPEISVQLTPAGSLGGLLAIQEGQADMAGIHLLDEETGEYNYPYVKHTLQNMEVAIVHLAGRVQGLIIARGNPKGITQLSDLKRPDVVFANRQKGSGTRVWLDYKLRELGIVPHEIRGYNHELDTHLAVGMAILKGEADVGLGIQAAANSCNLDFVAVTKERFDLVIPLKNYQSDLFAPLLNIIQSDEFKQVVNEMGGYDTAQTGATIFVK
jgi:molybdate-binding protein/DNA-binding transcriptional regulator YhcF (GntR family)